MQQGYWLQIDGADQGQWDDMMLVADFSVDRKVAVSLLGEDVVAEAETREEVWFAKQDLIWVSQKRFNDRVK